MTDRPLPLPSLHVAGFRGIDALCLPQLGRVSLVTGQNGVGKTTVLDAARLYASRGDPQVILDILRQRDERLTGSDPREVLADIPALFHDAADGVASAITIGSTCSANDLTIEVVERNDPRLAEYPNLNQTDGPLPVLSLTIGEVPRFFGLRADGTYLSERKRETVWPTEIPNESIGPSTLTNEDVGRLWDRVALTESEDAITEALRLVVRDGISRVTVIGGESKGHGRHPVVRLEGRDSPVPLKRLGAGATRLFGLALAIGNAKGGLLLIDEVENGVHHAVQRDLWQLLFELAQVQDVQVIATTHSWDCVVGFAKAALASESDGILYRLEPYKSNLEAIEYPEHVLEAATEQRIEVR